MMVAGEDTPGSYLDWILENSLSAIEFVDNWNSLSDNCVNLHYVK